MHRLIRGLILLLVTGCMPQSDYIPPQQPPMAPLMTSQTLGTSVEGRPIALYRFGTGPVGTLIIAGIHGNETSAIVVGERLVDLLKREAVPGLTESVAVIPLANPDGAAAGRRTNARTVDLNRNFPAKNWATTRKGAYHGGPTPLSEPESAVLHDAVQTLKPRRIISIHSIDKGRECNNFDGPGERLAARMSQFNGYPVRNTIGYPTPGSFGSWAGIDLQIPVITLELPRSEPGDQAWEKNREALLEALH
jgi:protein MpaA